MSRPIGPREAAMRAQREAQAKEQETAARKPTVADLTAKLPATSGKKPVKRKKAKKR